MPTQAQHDAAGEGDKDLELLSAISDNLKLCVDAQKEFNKVAEDDIDFSLGKQWSEEDKSILEEQRRPVLTFNKIKPLINLVSGHMMQNWSRVKVSPEGGEDKTFSSVCDKLIDHIDKRSKFERKMMLQFTGGLRAGRTWLEFAIDYERDPMFGELKANYMGPFKVYADPNGVEYDLSDREYMCKVVKISKGKLKQLYPKKKAALDEMSKDSDGELLDQITMTQEGDANNYGVDKSRSQIGINQVPGPGEEKGDRIQLTTTEYWYKKYVEKLFVYFLESGDVKTFDTDEEVKEEITLRTKTSAAPLDPATVLQSDDAVSVAAAHAALPPVVTVPKYKVRKQSVTEMWVAIKTGNILLAHGKSPFEPYYHGFPFFQFITEYAPEAKQEQWRVQGLTRTLKDAQIEKNKARSQYLHILNSSANSGWIGDSDALTPEKFDELQQFGSTPGIVIQKKPNSVLERIHPVEPSLAQQAREKAADDSFKEVSGINSDLLAVDASNNPSGKAIALRIRQAITILEPVFRNLTETKEQVGMFLFNIIPMMFDEKRVEKVLGPQFMQESQIDEAQISSFLAIIEDGKYNVTIEESGQSKTLREETLDNLMNMVEKGMPIPPDLILEFMNMPDQAEVVNRVKEYAAQQAQAAAAGAAQK